MQIKIIINEDVYLQGILNETSTAQKVYAALPIKGQGKTWGEEIYFASDVEAPLDNPREILAGRLPTGHQCRPSAFLARLRPAGDEIRQPARLILSVELKGICPSYGI